MRSFDTIFENSVKTFDCMPAVIGETAVSEDGVFDISVWDASRLSY